MSDVIDTLSKDGLHIIVSRSPRGGVTIRWTGISDARQPELVLGPFMKRLARDFKGEVVTIDFSGFEYMNSATVSPIIQFIKLLDAGDTPTVLLYDTNVAWQRVNFMCMKAIARTLKHVEVRGASSPPPPLSG
jgi:hypothetical protein